jgi:hypothetical protein
MVDSRAAILTGAKAAHTLHRDLGIRDQIERSGGGRVDVFGAIAKLGATLMFQPLDNLLGAYLPSDELGVLITTKRPLPVQRFTGAHELGHLYMRRQALARCTDGLAMDCNCNAGGREELPPLEGPQAASDSEGRLAATSASVAR